MAWYILSSIALLFVMVTMVARANDLRRRRNTHWQLRLIGFMLAGVMPIGIMSVEFVTATWPSPYETFFRIGLCFVFLTTPNQLPWWQWITRGEA